MLTWRGWLKYSHGTTFTEGERGSGKGEHSLTAERVNIILIVSLCHPLNIISDNLSSFPGTTLQQQPLLASQLSPPALKTLKVSGLLLSILINSSSVPFPCVCRGLFQFLCCPGPSRVYVWGCGEAQCGGWQSVLSYFVAKTTC